MHFVIVLLLVGAAQPYPFTSWFEQDPQPVPVIVDSVANPLDYAGARIGLDVRNVELPRGWEGGYRYCCRFPLIDHVSNRPLYMKQWAEETSELFSLTRRPTAVRDALGVLDGDRQELPQRWSQPLDEHALVAGGFTLRYATELSVLLGAMSNVRLPAMRDLSPDDSAAFAANPGAYLAPDGKRMADLTGNTDSQMEFIERARRVRVGQIEHAAVRLASAVSYYLEATAGFKVADIYEDTSRAHDVMSFDFGFGPVVIAGIGNDRHTRDAALLIDFGGNDTYLNNAGGTRRAGGVAVCIDHSGNDRYESPDSSYVQGFGFLGVGMLVDPAGDDVYRAKHYSQGAGILGVGLLWDKAGNDSFSAHTFCQGAGMFGLGMLLDDSGADVYDCASMGQGSATTLGFGVLTDLEGDDQYRLACDTTKDALGDMPGYGQGGALSFRASPWEKKLVAYGGVGLLVDDKGNDSYASNGWCSQGGSYIMSLGALVDNEGNDHYVGGTAQGSGIHVTNAILIDRKGDDVYEGGFRAGGSGGDRSPGFLIDYEGNDTYKSATSSYGTGCKPFSYSLFIDYKGDDHYICARPESTVLFNDWHSFGGVWPESDPNAWPYAISLDLGGKDDYQVRNRANNSETPSFGHGIHLDMEWKGGDVIGRPSEQTRIARPTIAELARRPRPPEMPWVLRDGDVFDRFSNVGDVVGEKARFLPQVALLLATQENRRWNRDLLECLHYWFVQDKIGEKELTDVVKLLKAKDPEVRLIIADDLGLWKVSAAEDALIEAANSDGNAQVRRFALRSLIRLESVKALPSARKLATEDTCEDVRRMAVTLLSKVKPDTANLSLLRWVLAEDHASSVRCAAADGLGSLGDPRGVDPLREAAKTFDVYVQRACGRALCQLYQVEGIQLLISSLSFPSIDAFYNYDRNVPNSIASFAGFDMPEPDRYVQAKWQAWFDRHRDSIDIHASADGLRAYNLMLDSIREKPESAQVTYYERFLARFPKHLRARSELANKLNGLAWGMVTAPKGTPAWQPQQGLVYARRAVELGNDPNIDDTFIEALLANGRKDEALAACRAALAKFPGNGMLEERRRKLEGR